VEPRDSSLTGPQVRRLAATALAAVGLRQLAIRVIALGGTIVLARLMLPHDFGAVAIGTTVVAVFGFAADSGIGAGLIRGPRAPERADLQSFLGLQLLVTTFLALVTAAIGLPNGVVGRVTVVMVASLPLAAFRSPGVILYERDLRFQPLVIIELVETVIFYVWAIATVLAGWGVWGLATATPVRAAAGAILMSSISPAGFMLPRLSWGRLRGLLGFGLQYQAVNAVALVRDQGLNLGTAVIGGVAVLGLWSLAYRILQLPFLLFDAVWRVSFPAMSRLLAAGEEPRPILERGLAMASMIAGGLLAALVGSAPALVPAVFGHQWSGVERVIPWAAVGLMFGGPVSVATAGYLYAVGDSGSVLLSGTVHALVWFAVSFSLLPVIGVQALGVGWLVSGVAEAAVLVWRIRRHIPLHVLRHLALPASLAALASLAGWLAASRLDPTLASTLAGAALATFIYGVAMLIFRRPLLADMVSLGRRSLTSLGR